MSPEKLSEYLTSVAAGRPSTRLAEHIAGCDECSRRIEALLAVDNLLASVPSEPLPDQLWQNISNRLTLREPATRKKFPSFKRLTAFAGVTGVVAALVLAAGVYFSPESTDDLEAFSNRHVAVATAAGLIQDISPDTLLAELSGEAGFNVRYPQNIPEGWKLTGGGTFTCPMGRKVSHLVFQKGSSVLSIFQKAGGGAGLGLGRGGGKGYGNRNRWGRQGQHGMGYGTGCRLFSVAGQQLAVCTDGRFRFTVTGGLPAEQLVKIAENLAAAR